MAGATTAGGMQSNTSFVHCGLSPRRLSSVRMSVLSVWDRHSGTCLACPQLHHLLVATSPASRANPIGDFTNETGRLGRRVSPKKGSVSTSHWWCACPRPPPRRCMCCLVPPRRVAARRLAGLPPCPLAVDSVWHKSVAWWPAVRARAAVGAWWRASGCLVGRRGPHRCG